MTKLTPIHPLYVEAADIPTKRAFTALGDGEASAHQQAIVVNFLIHQVCRTHDLSVRFSDQGGEVATAIAEGRRFVGLNVIRLMNKSLVKEPAQPSLPATNTET